jgi:hypothetical protein
MVQNSFIQKNIYLNSKISFYFRELNLALLFVLIGIDLIFMALHALKSLGYLSNPNFSVTQNWGYPETFQYLKAAFLTGCFFWLGAKYKRPQFYCWAIIFLYVLLDDSLEIHEILGYHAGEQLENAGIAGGKTLGELLTFALMGFIIFIPLFYFFFVSKHRNLKIMTQDLFMLFVMMLIFGVGVDVLHDLTEVGTVINGALGLLEDGGEMMAMSVMCWYTWTFIRSDNFLEKEKTETDKQRKTIPQAKTKQKDHPALSKTAKEPIQTPHREHLG